MFGHGHSIRAVFGHDPARAGFCLATVTLFRQSVRTRSCSGTVTLYAQSVRTRFCSGRILFGHGQSVRAECSDTILLGQDSVRPLPYFPPRVSFSINVFERELRIFKFLYSSACDTKNALGDVKDQAEDKANPKPWYTADEKSGKMSTEDLQDLIREYPFPEGWYARLPGLQEPANYGTKFETGIYEEQVKSGYRLPLHPFALRFFEHYRMAPGQLVPNGWRKLAGLIYLVQTSRYKPDATDFMRGGPKSNKGWHSRYFFVGRLDKWELPFDRDWNPFCKDFENPGKPTPNNLTKHILSHIKLRGDLCIDEPLSEEQLEWAKIIPPKPIPVGLLIPSPPPAIPSATSAETILLGRWLAEVENRPKEVFLAFFRRPRGSEKRSGQLWSCPLLLRECSPRILEQVSIDDDLISEQHLLHGILPRDKEVFQTQTHETFDCSFAQAVYTMYANGSEMLSRFEMARQVAADEAQQKREAVKEAQEAFHRSKEVTKARDQGIRDFLDGNAGDEWLKKRTDDGLEIYELGFAKAKEMFAERFPDIPLGDFVLPAIVSPSGETVIPSEVGDATASHLPGEGPSGDAPEP
ncbi:hypothetical protein RJ639_032304 [Escallonia herrerae]|uniref:Transposase (putative) gypsy type domain-containing protein n=1 Tax=Escallonia herrerae TaxID=1293975 RepID=A0AA88WXM5_9ASTE|nr:hypothetical protein RJ639_032304 [Escallonia herrerae]